MVDSSSNSNRKQDEINEGKIIYKKQWMIKSHYGHIEKFIDMTSVKEIGHGQVGVVLKGQELQSKQQRAIKVIPKNLVRNPNKFLHELNILKSLDHPNIIKLYEGFEDQRNVYLIFELCTGQQLLEKIQQQDIQTENQARETFLQMTQAIAYCHENKICHQDIKPQNFIYVSKHEDALLKLIDFGLSAIFSDDGSQQSGFTKQKKFSNPEFVAPEVFTGQQNQLCDVWSLGVILFQLMSGVLPFQGKNQDELIKNITNCDVQFNIGNLKNISENAKDLIRSCLQPQAKRISIKDVLNHKWVVCKLTKQISLELNYQQLNNFHNFEKLKKVSLYFIASQLDESEIQELGRQFKQLDKNNDGTLTIDEISQAIKQSNVNLSKELSNIMGSIDTDGSGTINYSEFIAATIQKSIYMKEEKLFQAFKMLDLDESGKISKSELRTVLEKDKNYQQKSDQFWDDLIKEADINGDGEIDYHEFILMMNKGSPEFIK